MDELDCLLDPAAITSMACQLFRQIKRSSTEMMATYTGRLKSALNKTKLKEFQIANTNLKEVVTGAKRFTTLLVPSQYPSLGYTQLPLEPAVPIELRDLQQSNPNSLFGTMARETDLRDT